MITRWRDDAAFEAWLTSPAFAHGHRSEGAAPAEHGEAGHGHGGEGHGSEGHGGEGHGSEGHGGERPVGVSSEVWSYEIAGGSAHHGH